jgi:hypothetical protein
VSLILDALRRKSTDREGHDDEPGRAARADAVLATLGYARPTKRKGPPLRTMLVYGGAAILIGFTIFTGVILLLAPSSAPKPASVGSSAARDPAAATPAPSRRRPSWLRRFRGRGCRRRRPCSQRRRHRYRHRQRCRRH